jgi:protein O-GlcNAc transferase
MNSITPDTLLATAKEHHIAGRIDLAAQLYRQILDSAPRHVEAQVLLGFVALDCARNTEAVEHFRKAIAIDPNCIDAHLHLGMALRNLNQDELAIGAFKRSIAIYPDYAAAYIQLASTELKLGRESNAADAYEQCLKLEPNHLEAINNLGNIRKSQKRLVEAAQLYHRALSLDPENPDLKFNFSQAAQDMQRYDISIPVLQEAIAQKPNVAEWHLLLANAFVATDNRVEAIQACDTAIRLNPRLAEPHFLRGSLYAIESDFVNAEKCFRQAIELRPNYTLAMSNLGAACQRLAKIDEALHWYQQTLLFDPSSINALHNLGLLFHIRGKFDTALSYFKRLLSFEPDHIEGLLYYAILSSKLMQFDQAALALERIVFLDPKHTVALLSLGDIYQEQRHHDLALEVFRRALATAPEMPNLILRYINQKQVVCDWDGLDEQSDRFLNTIENTPPCSIDDQVAPFMVIALSKPITCRQQFIQTKKFVRSHVEQIHPRYFKHQPADCSFKPDRRIRVGYFSGDFKTHPVGYLVSELFETHDRSRFEIFGYSYGPEEKSPLRSRITRAFDHFRDVYADSFEGIAKRIADDQIDILVDLQGFTARSRTDVMLMRPAPIQVTYLGYPGTMAMDCVDYILVDEYVAPREQQEYYAEELIHLPGCFMVNDSKREIDPVTPVRQHLGLPEDGFVFCAFNSNYKMTRPMFEVWMRLLQAVPRSVLWLRDSNRFAVENLKKEANRCGISEDRLVMAPGMPMPKHLARHRAADLFLDTFPYNQHSTAADALRMGLPMVTLSGDTFASRVAGSLLQTLGLSELIASSFEEYEAIATKLTLDPIYMREVRRKLQQSLSTTDLYDGASFARKVELAYEKMWTRFCEDQAVKKT